MCFVSGSEKFEGSPKMKYHKQKPITSKIGITNAGFNPPLEDLGAAGFAAGAVVFFSISFENFRVLKNETMNFLVNKSENFKRKNNSKRKFCKNLPFILFNRGTSLSKIGETKNIRHDNFLLLNDSFALFKDYLFLFNVKSENITFSLSDS